MPSFVSPDRKSSGKREEYGQSIILERRNCKIERRKKENKFQVSSESSESLSFCGTVSPGCAVGLWPTFDIRTRSPELDCLDHGRRRGIPDQAPDKQRGHEDTNQRYSVGETRGGD